MNKSALIRFLIIKGCADMYRRMATKFDQSTVAPLAKGRTRKAKAKAPLFVDIAAQARRALRDGKGTDVTGLSHAERNKIIFGK